MALSFYSPVSQCTYRPRRQLTCYALSSKKPLQGPGVVNISAKARKNTPVIKVSDPNASLGNFMKETRARFPSMRLPLGGDLRQVDKDHLELIVPRIQLFDVWLQPKAMATIKVADDHINIFSSECTLKGSSHVAQFQLNERFSMIVDIHMSWTKADSRQPQLITEGYITVTVDVPPPFSMLPKMVLQKTGDTALAATLTVILNTFMASLARDYERWANSSAIQQRTPVGAGKP